MLSCSIVKCSTYCCAQGSIAKFRGSPDPLLIFVSCLNTNHGGLVTVRHLICSSYLHATGLKNILRLYRAVKITYLIERYRSSLYSPPHSVRNPFPAFVLRARRRRRRFPFANLPLATARAPFCSNARALPRIRLFAGRESCPLEFDLDGIMD